LRTTSQNGNRFPLSIWSKSDPNEKKWFKYTDEELFNYDDGPGFSSNVNKNQSKHSSTSSWCKNIAQTNNQESENAQVCILDTKILLWVSS